MIITKKRVSEEFGTLLKQKLSDKKISMSALGKASGVHRTTVSDYIAGKYLPKEETFHRIHQIIPDEDLYNAYFTAVNSEAPRKNKQLIPDSTPYNYYKAGEENMKAAEAICKKLNDAEIILKQSKISTLDREYIALALKFIIDYLDKTGVGKLVKSDYDTYKRLYREFSDM